MTLDSALIDALVERLTDPANSESAAGFPADRPTKLPQQHFPPHAANPLARKNEINGNSSPSRGHRRDRP